MFIEFASLQHNKEMVEPVSSIILTTTSPTFPVITVALFLIVATVASCGITDRDDCCPRQSPPGHFPVGKFSSHGLAVHM